MRWCWVLLATSPCGSAGAKEHSHPFIATGSNAASAPAWSAHTTLAGASVALAACIMGSAALVDVAILDVDVMNPVSTPRDPASDLLASSLARGDRAVGHDSGALSNRHASNRHALESLEHITLEGLALWPARAEGANDTPGA